MRAELTNRELITFCDQLHLVIHAGISGLEGIAIMREDAQGPEARELLDEIYRELELSGSLSGALSVTGVFPPYMLHLTELGEQAGKLDEVFASLVTYYEREESIAKGIKNAVTYPLIMLIIMFAVVIVLITKVMPVFAQVFEQMGTALNGFSQGILQIGFALNHYAVVFAVILAVFACLCLYLFCTKKGRMVRRHWFAKFPPTRKIAEKIAAARFADGMSMCLSAGLDIDRSMELVAALTENPVLREKISVCRNLIAEGGSFSAAAAQAGIFSGMQARMLNIGFQTGAMEEVMEKAASRYEEEVDAKIQNTLSVLEPTLVAVLSVVVGIILLSVMLPLAGIMSNIG